VFFRPSPGRRTGACVAALVLLAACGQKEKQAAGPEIIAVLPTEDLSPEAPLDAWAAVIPTLLNEQFQGLPTALGVRAHTPGDAVALKASRLVHTSVARGREGILFEATIEDTRRHKMSAWSTTAKNDEELLQSIGALGKTLRSDARGVATLSTAAVRAYAAGNYSEAVKADPNFGLAWQAWVESAARAGKTAEAKEAVAAGLRNGAAMPALEKARLQELGAELGTDPAERVKRLGELARLEPANLELLIRAATSAMAARQFAMAVALLQGAVAANPDSGQALNLLGYAQAYAGNDTAAKEALTRYMQLEPGSANPLDSMGEVALRSGRFEEAAERFEGANAKDATFLGGQPLRKAALARMYAGDLQGARKTMEKYFGALPDGLKPALPLLRGQWEYISGQAQNGMARVKEVAEGKGPVASLGASQMALWALEVGDRVAAARWIARGREAGAGRDAATWLTVASFVALPPAPAEEWGKRGEKLRAAAPQMGVTADTALALALTLQKAWPQAGAEWEKIRRALDPGSEGRAREMELFCRLESGAKPGAKELGIWPIPLPEAFDMLAFLTHPNLIHSRGLGAEREGKHEDARRYYELFLKLSAGRADVFGAQENARRAARL
jgi:tetratricopeptide (TPR) repeat protein